MKVLVNIFFILFLLFLSDGYAQNKVIQVKKQPITIATGDTKASNYPVGISLAKVLLMNAKLHGVEPNVVPTMGNVENINGVISGTYGAAIVPADAEFRAYNGLGEWVGMKQGELRSIINLAPEYIQLIVTESSGIKTLRDLKNKNIAIGLDSFSTKLPALDILYSYKYDNTTVNIDNTSAPLPEVVKMMQGGQLDGFFIISSAPIRLVQELSNSTKIRMVDMENVDVLKSGGYAGYSYEYISKANYPLLLNPNSPKVIKVPSTLVVSASLPNSVAYILAKEIVENLETLKTLHPILKNLNLSDMLKDITAPIHPGAMRYFMDKGLKK